MHDDSPTPPRGVGAEEIEIEFVEVDPETGIEKGRTPVEEAPPPGEVDGGGREVDRLRELVDQMQLELNQVRDRYLRKLAEFDNFRKRVDREREELRRTAAELLVRELIPVLDNFDRAIRHAGESDCESFRTGVEMIARQLWETLERQGLESIDPTGTPFAPELHEAVQRVEEPGVAPGTVAWTLAKGYLFGGKMVRPAMVGVVVPAAADDPSSGRSRSALSDEGEGLS